MKNFKNCLSIFVCLTWYYSCAFNNIPTESQEVLLTNDPISSTINIQTKPWHVSPPNNPMSSTAYPAVGWSTIEKLYIGMSTKEAKELVRELQTDHHPVNAIVFSRYKDTTYEVALKLSKDGTFIEDISYKCVHSASGCP